jgi:hypothetical protein
MTHWHQRIDLVAMPLLLKQFFAHEIRQKNVYHVMTLDDLAVLFHH